MSLISLLLIPLVIITHYFKTIYIITHYFKTIYIITHYFKTIYIARLRLTKVKASVCINEDQTFLTTFLMIMKRSVI